MVDLSVIYQEHTIWFNNLKSKPTMLKIVKSAILPKSGNAIVVCFLG